jgi:hypothetical protein
MAVTHRSLILWSMASVLGSVGLGATLIGLALLAYASIWHLTGSGKQVRWQWHTGAVWLSLRLFFGGLILQIIAFVGRLALGG